VLSHTVAEDAGQAPGFGLGVHRRPGAMIFEQSTLTCRQTSRPTRILDLSFSLRSYPGEGDPAFMEKSLKLFGSVVIE
jgi:hypothetical protein